MFKLFLLSTMSLVLLVTCAKKENEQPAKMETSQAEWIPLIKDNSLDGWFVR